MNKEPDKNQIQRPPVVAVMGHIDHGKSTLLDYIRSANTTAKEAGGITQHVSAYEAEVETSEGKRRITFLDTPGHEAFSSIRERSASAADLAILVVSVEDGVKPQTLEALNCIKRDGMPYIIALTKIDRAKNSLDKVKQNLAENDIFVEGWGGNVPVVPVSGKTGEGVPELLELIVLQADLEGWSADPRLPAEGAVIESELNPKQGISATLIVKNGTLKVGSFVAAHGAYAPVRLIESYKGESLKEISFSSPARIVGWSAMPSVGSRFKAFAKKEEAVEFASKEPEPTDSCSAGAVKSSAFLEMVVKADTVGTLNAVERELGKLNTEKIGVKIVSKGIGAVSEGDVKAAGINKCVILGFNVSIDKSAEALAMRDGIEIKTYRIIYELIDYAKEKLKEATPVETVETVTGSAKVLKVFSQNKDKQVVGGRAEEGEIKSGAPVKIYRRDALVGQGKVKELQSQKIKTDSVKEGQEFGMMLESKIEVVPGDYLKVTSLIRQE